MARIETFDAGNLRLNPTEVGVDAEAQAARRIGTFYNQNASATEMLASETSRLGAQTQQLGRETSELGSEKGAAMAQAGRAIGGGIADAGDAAVKYMDHQQISHGDASWATMLQQVTQDWENTKNNADPNDPTVASRFMEGLNTRLSNFQENGFYTENAQKWAETRVDALRQHMAEKTMVDMSSLAGQAAKVNQRQTVNSLSATVHNDPTSIDFALAALDHSTESLVSSSPNLRAEHIAQVRGELRQVGAESIVKSAAIGYIEKNAAMPPWISDPKYSQYVNGAELKQFENAAKVQAKANELTAKQTQVANRQVADLKAHADANKAFTDNVTINPATNEPVIKPGFFNDALAVARNNPGAPSAALNARTLLDWGEHQQNRRAAGVQSDPATRQDLTDRMFSADNPTTEIQLMKAQVDGKLSKDDFTSMHRLVTTLNQSPLKGPVWQDTMKAVQARLIDPMSTDGDPIGKGNYAKFVQNFIPQYLAKQRAGTLEPNALDVNDPNSFISKSIASIRSSRSMQSDLQNRAQSPSGLPPEKDITGVSITPAPVATSTPRPQAPKPPEKGFVKDGYEFLGGNPGDARNWRSTEQKS